MNRAYKIGDSRNPHFITLTVIEWIDLFTRKQWCFVLLESLEYCRQRKGLVVHAWVIMTNHVHLIISSDVNELSNILRDLKRHFSTTIRNLLPRATFESRRSWLQNHFSSGKSRNWQLWQSGFHPKELTSNVMIDQKLNYLHENPVRAGIVYQMEDYEWSSAVDCAGGKGLLEVEFL